MTSRFACRSIAVLLSSAERDVQQGGGFRSSTYASTSDAPTQVAMCKVCNDRPRPQVCRQNANWMTCPCLIGYFTPRKRTFRALGRSQSCMLSCSLMRMHTHLAVAAHRSIPLALQLHPDHSHILVVSFLPHPPQKIILCLYTSNCSCFSSSWQTCRRSGWRARCVQHPPVATAITDACSLPLTDDAVNHSCVGRRS